MGTEGCNNDNFCKYHPMPFFLLYALGVYESGCPNTQYKWPGTHQQVPDTLYYLLEGPGDKGKHSSTLAHIDELRTKILYMISNRDHHSSGLYENTHFPNLLEIKKCELGSSTLLHHCLCAHRKGVQILIRKNYFDQQTKPINLSSK